VAHGNLSVEVRTILEPSQPLPFSEGETRVVPQRDVYAEEEPDMILTLDEGVTVKELVEALNALGVSARDMIAILQAMRVAGALHAEIVSL
jgi:flagellar P-ring protein precursor FlgI